jgi:hypothetical protein
MSLNTILATTPLTSTNYVLKATGTTIGNSLIFDNGTNVGIGNTNTTYKLDVSGTGRFTDSTTLAGIYFTTNDTPQGSQGTITKHSVVGLVMRGITASVFDWSLYSASGNALITNPTGTNNIGFNSGQVWFNGGNVGIGTSSPLNVLDVRAASATMGNYQTIQAFSTDSAAINLGGGISLGGYFTGTTSIAQFGSIVGRKENSTSGNYDGYLAFGTNAQATGVVERMRITSAGLVGIGTSDPFAKLSIASPQGITSFPTYSTNDQASINWWYWASAAEGYTRYMDIAPKGAPDGTYGGSVIRFLTNTITNASNPVERMRITSGGSVCIGLTSSGSNVFAVSPNGTISSLYVNSSGGVGSYSFGTGTIYSNAGILSNTPPSDERLKENITNISWGLSDILKLRPVSYHWKDDKVNQGVQFGFIAQEVQDVMPEAIKEFGEDVKYLGLEKDAIYATLVKAIQEQNQTIQELSNRLIKLESK